MSIDQYLLVLMINQTFKIDMKHGLAYISILQIFIKLDL